MSCSDLLRRVEDIGCTKEAEHRHSNLHNEEKVSASMALLRSTMNINACNRAHLLERHQATCSDVQLAGYC